MAMHLIETGEMNFFMARLKYLIFKKVPYNDIDVEIINDRVIIQYSIILKDNTFNKTFCLDEISREIALGLTPEIIADKVIKDLKHYIVAQFFYE